MEFRESEVVGQCMWQKLQLDEADVYSDVCVPQAGRRQEGETGCFSGKPES